MADRYDGCGCPCCVTWIGEIIRVVKQMKVEKQAVIDKLEELLRHWPKAHADMVGDEEERLGYRHGVRDAIVVVNNMGTIMDIDSDVAD